MSFSQLCYKMQYNIRFLKIYVFSEDFSSAELDLLFNEFIVSDFCEFSRTA